MAPPVTVRPANALYWSQITTWQTVALHGGYTYTADGSIRFPMDNDDVKIPYDLYIVVDTVLPILKHLQIDGILEFENSLDHYLRANVIFINGGQLIVGWENDPILTNVTIELIGTKTNRYDFILPDQSTTFGSKSIGVYGGNSFKKNYYLTFLNSIFFCMCYFLKSRLGHSWQAEKCDLDHTK